MVHPLNVGFNNLATGLAVLSGLDMSGDRVPSDLTAVFYPLDLKPSQGLNQVSDEKGS